MTWTTRPAVRANVGLLIGIAGPTGSGKTYSALRLATGLAGGEKFVVIDTEHERALMYADEFKFDHCPFDPPFRPARYADVIAHHLKLGYRVIVVDSTSHVWAGEGGIIDWREEILDKMVERAKKKREDAREWELRETFAWPSWSEPKQSYKRELMQKIISLPPNHHLILCFRAEPKLDMVTGADGKKKIAAKEGATGRDGWFPICEKNMPFELTVSHLTLPERPGVPLPIKCPEKLRPFFPLDAPIDESAGRRLADWARGSSSGSEVHPSQTAKENAGTVGAVATEPSAESDDPRERAKLIASIKALAPKVSTADRENAKKTYGIADPQAAALSSLREYESWLKTRAGEAA